MTVTPAARTAVEPPPFTPLPYGLLAAATPASVTTRDSHWRNGVQFQPDFCGADNIAEARCLSDGLDLEPLDGGLPIRGADPFAVYAWIPCGPLSYADQAAAEARVTAALTNTEQTAVELAFWTGDGQGSGIIYPHLASNSEVTEGTPGFSEVVELQTAASNLTTGGPLDVVEAVGALEGALASCYGGVGVLHVPRTLIAHLSARGVIKESGNVLKTTNGTVVAAGAGYPGTAPNGAAATAGSLWVYITGAVSYWRSGVEINTHDWREAIDREVNDLVMVASRTYVLGWDCCHFAAQVSTGGVRAGTAGAAT